MIAARPQETIAVDSRPRSRLVVLYAVALFGFVALTVAFAVGYPAVGIGLVGAGVFAYLCARRPAVSLAVLVFYGGVVSGLLKAYYPASTAIVVSADGLAAIAIGVAVGRGRFEWPLSRLHVVVASLIPLAIGVAILNPLSPSGLQLIGGLRTLILYPMFFLVAACCLESTWGRILFLRTVLTTTTVLGVISIIQYMAGPAWSIQHHIAQRVVRDWASSAGAFRPASVLGQPGVAGVLFGCGLLVAILTIVCPPDTSSVTRWTAWIALACNAAGLALSGERAGHLGFGAGLVALIVLTRSRGLVAAVALVAGGLMFVSLALPSANPDHRATSVTSSASLTSVAVRLRTWEAVIRQVPNYPFGHGPGHTGSAASRFGDTGASVLTNVLSDNYEIKLLYELGIPGLAWYLAFAWLAIAVGWREARRGSWWGTLVVALMAQQLTTGLFNNILDPVPYNLIFWSVLAGAASTGVLGGGRHAAPPLVSSADMSARGFDVNT